jgi:DNA polymerase-4
VGLAHNKFLAKLGSDIKKPNGLVFIEPETVHSFLDPMPIKRMWGVGKKTAPKLKALGILTIGQLRRTDLSILQPVLGNRTEHFLRLSRGEDERAVTPDRPDKSISHEVTFDKNVSQRNLLLAELQKQSEDVSRRLRAQGLMAATVTVKIRDPSFRTVTRSLSMRACSNSTKTLYQIARALFEKWREGHKTTPVRLLGMGVSGLEESHAADHAAGDLADSRSDQQLDRVVDTINQKFGTAGVSHGRALSRKKP